MLLPLVGNAATPQIWYAPLDPVSRGSYSGSPQYMSLFTPSAPWTTAASHVNVFKIYPQWINDATDSNLQIQFADLNRRGIALALEYGPITAPSQCGTGVEGSSGETLVAAAQRIQRDGGTLRYLAMDEPIYYFTLYAGQNSCQWTVDQMAANAAVNVHALLAQFPNVIVGDIEPVPIYSPNWLAQYQAGVEAFRGAFGFPLAFFDADVLWRSPSYLTALSSLRSMLVSQSVPLGIIYNGDSDSSDADWIQSASNHMDAIELTLGSPDLVIFQSWTLYPQKLLPETDTDSFPYLIDSYFRSRTLLTASLTDGILQGTLIRADNGQPIANAPVNLNLSLTTGSGAPAVYTLTGNVPAGTQSVVIGARVNAECACSSNANLLISGFTWNAASTVITRDFSNQLNGWDVALGGSPPPTVQIQGSSLQILAQPAQSVMLNSSPIPTSAGVPYTLSISAQVAPVSSSSGYFDAIFLDSASTEISRATTPFTPATQSASTMADSLGRFSIALPYTGPGAFQVMATYAGSTDYWPAQSSEIQTSSAALGISETHIGNFSRGQNGAIYTVNVSNSAGAASTSGVVNVDETIPAGLTPVSMSGFGWTCPGLTHCTRTDALMGGASYAPIIVTVNVASNAPSSITSEVTVSGGGSASATAADPTSTGTTGSSFTVAGQVTLSQAAMSGVTMSVSGSASGATSTDAYGNYILSGLGKGGNYTITPTDANYIFNPLSATVNNLSADQLINFTAMATNGLVFYPVTPCRIADTRTGAGFSGQFGPPSMAGGTTRVFNIPSSSCGIPATAAAYALNFTVVPPTGGPQANLTTWPAGQSAMPNVSTLNYSGSVVANAAIVPAGSNGAINVFVNYPTDVLFDINGYFASPQVFSQGLEFYPLTPCRIADTRNGAGFSGQFGPPSMSGGIRSFNPTAGSCGIPITAAAYSLNFTVVPPSSGPQSNLTTWPAGQANMPNVSTLNYAGNVVANAAIVPAGTNSAIDVFANHPTDVLFDVNGYFALPTASSLHFYAVTPCRIADTRSGAGFSGQFGPPTMPGRSTRSFTIPASSCAIPATAVAYSLNFTVVPPAGGPQANLTTWPAGQPGMPNVSTLNYSGSVVANAAIVPAGANGAINVYVNYTTDVLFDINGYFAP
jgi:hypothetical protein